MPARGSHRSGRAQFAHPAPHATDSQDLNGYPLLFRVDGPGARCPRHLSLERFHGTASPSLHRVSHRPGFPGFDGTMGCSESLPPIPPHFVAFVWRYHMRAGSFAPVGCPARGLPQAGAHWSPGRPRVRGSHVETTGPPRFLGDPHGRALLSDPDGTSASGRLRRLGAAFRVWNSVGSRGFGSYGAQSHGPCIRCLRFAGRITPPPRKTRFWLLARLCQAGLVTRWVPTKGFSMSHNIPSSFPRLSLAQTKRTHLWSERSQPTAAAALALARRACFVPELSVNNRP